MLRAYENVEIGKKGVLKLKREIERKRLKQICSSNWKSIISTHNGGIYGLDIDQNQGKL
jgi:hypothetical protein